MVKPPLSTAFGGFIAGRIAPQEEFLRDMDPFSLGLEFPLSGYQMEYTESRCSKILSSCSDHFGRPSSLMSEWS
jgi:hypothetical protein